MCRHQEPMKKMYVCVGACNSHALPMSLIEHAVAYRCSVGLLLPKTCPLRVNSSTSLIPGFVFYLISFTRVFLSLADSQHDFSHAFGGRDFGHLKIVSQQTICRQQQVQLNSWAMRGSCTLLPMFFFHRLLIGIDSLFIRGVILWLIYMYIM